MPRAVCATLRYNPSNRSSFVGLFMLNELLLIRYKYCCFCFLFVFGPYPVLRSECDGDDSVYLLLVVWMEESPKRKI